MRKFVFFFNKKKLLENLLALLESCMRNKRLEFFKKIIFL